MLLAALQPTMATVEDKSALNQNVSMEHMALFDRGVGFAEADDVEALTALLKGKKDAEMMITHRSPNPTTPPHPTHPKTSPQTARLIGHATQ